MDITQLEKAHKEFLKLKREQNKDKQHLAYKKWYEKKKDDELYKEKQREYHKQYYLKNKSLKKSIAEI
jgi:hypothetical protein